MAVKKGLKISEYGVFRDSSGRRIAGRHRGGGLRGGRAAVDPARAPGGRRRDRGRARADALPRLLELDDIRGDLHCHTNATDGHHTIEALVDGGRQRGYEYVAVTDHSPSTRVARRPHRRGAARARRADPGRPGPASRGSRCWPGASATSCPTARSTIPDEVLPQLDLVIAAVHARLQAAAGRDDAPDLPGPRPPARARPRPSHRPAHRRARALRARPRGGVPRRPGATARRSRSTPTPSGWTSTTSTPGAPTSWACCWRSPPMRTCLDHLGCMELGVATARRGWTEKRAGREHVASGRARWPWQRAATAPLAGREAAPGMSARCDSSSARERCAPPPPAAGMRPPAPRTFGADTTGCYYELDAPEISDAEYDRLVREAPGLEASVSGAGHARTAPPSAWRGARGASSRSVEHRAPCSRSTASRPTRRSRAFEPPRAAGAWRAPRSTGSPSPKSTASASRSLYRAGRARPRRDPGRRPRRRGRHREISGRSASIPAHARRPARQDDELEVRGEVFMPRGGLRQLNRALARRAASRVREPPQRRRRSVRQKDPRVTARRPLGCSPYHVSYAPGLAGRDATGRRCACSAACGLRTNPRNRRSSATSSGAVAYCRRSSRRARRLEYEADGVVVKVDALDQQRRLGRDRPPPPLGHRPEVPGPAGDAP